MFVYPLGLALGADSVDVPKLLDEFGPVRDGFLDRTGFTTLRVASREQTALDLAIEAASEPGLGWTDGVDAVIFVSSTTTLVAPGNAHLIQAELGLSQDALLLDINDACTGFVRGLVLIDGLLQSGSASKILFVLADTYSKLYDRSDLKVSPLFADGASAMLVSSQPIAEAGGRPGREWQIVGRRFVSEGAGAEQLKITRSSDGLGALAMNGSGVLNFVLKNGRKFVGGLLETSGVQSDDFDRWYVHQGSRTVVDAVAKIVDRPGQSLFRSGTYGNTVGSSLPFQFFEDDVSEQTSTLGFLGFGVGLSMAGIVVQERPLEANR